MRLTTEQHDKIITFVKRLCGDDAVVKLFGSRVDDTRRGGDIDLYVETHSQIPYKVRLLLEYRLSSILDTKVDLVIKMPNGETKDIQAIAQKGITL